ARRGGSDTVAGAVERGRHVFGQVEGNAVERNPHRSPRTNPFGRDPLDGRSGGRRTVPANGEVADRRCPGFRGQVREGTVHALATKGLGGMAFYGFEQRS